MRGTRRPHGSVALATVVLAVVLMVGSPTAAAGQRASLGFELQSWGHEELRRFAGGLFRVEWPVGAEMFFHLGLSGWDGDGTVCSGLFDPTVCVFEPLDYSSTSFGFGAGWALGRWPVAGGEVGLVPFAGFAFATLAKNGTITGRGDSDSVAMAEAGVALRYRTPPLLWERVAIFGEGRVSAGWSPNLGCEDCYDVLRGGTRRRSVLIGVAVGR